ncbi:MAG: cell wall hydrolase [Bacillota bacterium]
MLNRFNLKVIIFTLVFTLFAPYILSLAPLVDTPTVQAGFNLEVSGDDVSKGVALALLFFAASKLMDDRSEAKSDLDDISDSDVGLLARIIHAEARGEPYRGQVAVGAVVLNRVESSEFPNTIQGVIYQEGQFTPVKNGQFNLKPDSSSYRAAKEALDGRDPSQGALYFYNPDKARTLWWLSTRETTVKIGDHVFAK